MGSQVSEKSIKNVFDPFALTDRWIGCYFPVI